MSISTTRAGAAVVVVVPGLVVDVDAVVVGSDVVVVGANVVVVVVVVEVEVVVEVVVVDPPEEPAPRPDTAVGTDLVVVVPSPICPFVFQPQHDTELLLSSAHE